MNESAKVSTAHLRRRACVYIRQSTAAQVEHNRESTERQYRLVERAVTLGWRSDQVTVIDEDLGISGGGLVERTGFARLTSDVALGHVGIVLGLEVSRLARNTSHLPFLTDQQGLVAL
jgi:DNA invertase Pin-like site-specific DNA recombinase